MLIYRDTEEALELIDSYSRVYFPSVFGFVMVSIKCLIRLTYRVQINISFQLIYWPLYLWRTSHPSTIPNYLAIINGD